MSPAFLRACADFYAPPAPDVPDPIVDAATGLPCVCVAVPDGDGWRVVVTDGCEAHGHLVDEQVA